MPQNGRAPRSRAQRAPSRTKGVQQALRNHAGQGLTTDQGIPVSDDQNSLKGGERGPSLLEDFILREKLTHFDHERIPERVVHARGSGAHGVFRVYEPLADLTSAAFLQDPAVETPVFVRFSTVQGFRGSADSVRDVRGFAAKFYTEEGNFDLVGNNMPVFFIQDSIKFPDLVHALKPEPDNAIPQASTAHDTFWDFIWLTPESTHMIMWVMSDRALPRSYRMMEGFGVHTFRLVDADGVSRFVKFHWKPVLGIHSLVWDEAQKLAGRDPDYHRRDLWNSIELGHYPEFELGIQVLEEDQVDQFPFDVLDATKVWPEEQIPVRLVGKLTLNRNPENFFAETEQVAFHLANLVPGIDVSDDPLLQGRLFSYLDTQLIRLGGPNFTQLPINQAQAPVHHNYREGYNQARIDVGKVAYSPNSLQGGHPREQHPHPYASYPARVEGQKVRVRSASFGDHFSQATLFWNSMSPIERDHIVMAFQFELGHVRAIHVRERMVDILTNVDLELASRVAEGIGVAPPGGGARAARQALARLRGDWEQYGTTGLPGARLDPGIEASPALSQMNSAHDEIMGRRVAVLAADGVDAAAVGRVLQTLVKQGCIAEVVSFRQGTLTTLSGAPLVAEHTLLTMPSVVYDGIFIPGSASSVETLAARPEAIEYVTDAFRHGKAIAMDAAALALLAAAGIEAEAYGEDEGIIVARSAAEMRDLPARFAAALAKHRFFERAQRPLARTTPQSRR
jgi:catalase